MKQEMTSTLAALGIAIPMLVVASVLEAAPGQAGGQIGGAIKAPGAGALPKSVAINDPVRLRVIVPNSGSYKYFVYLQGTGLLDCVQVGARRHCDRMLQRHAVARIRVNRQTMGDPTLGLPESSIWIQREGWQGQCAADQADVCELRMATDRTLYIAIPVPSGG